MYNTKACSANVCPLFLSETSYGFLLNFMLQVHINKFAVWIQFRIGSLIYSYAYLPISAVLKFNCIWFLKDRLEC
jgi:hypothetical protein